MPETTTDAPLPIRRWHKRSAANKRARRLLEALDAWRCPNCGRNNPEIYSTSGPVRHVRCTVCGQTGKLYLA